MGAADFDRVIFMLEVIKNKAELQNVAVSFAVSELRDILENHIFLNCEADVPRRLKAVLAMLENVN